MTLQTNQINKEEKKDSKANIGPAPAHPSHPNQKETNHENNHEHKVESEEIKKISDKPIEKSSEKKIRKEEAVAYGLGMRASKKHCAYICKFIKNKNVDKAIYDLGLVAKLKKAVPFKGEIPHRKGMMSGRYPVNAANLFVKLLKGLRGNILNNSLDLDKTRIYFASANWASRPRKSQGRKAKRANVILKAKEMEIK